ncbi:Transcription factor 21 [Chamberlinius hualienensis]
MARKRKESNMDRNGHNFRDKPIQRNAANARERARMRVLSKAFSRLKTTLPWVPPDTKLSKLDTLRLAASYIAHLRQILATDEDQQGPNIHPINLTWPFTFNAIKPQECDGDLNDDDGEDDEDEDEEEDDENMDCNGGRGVHRDIQQHNLSTNMHNMNGYYTSNNHFVQPV